MPRRVLFALATAALLLSGCGGGSDDDPPSDAASPADDESPSATASGDPEAPSVSGCSYEPPESSGVIGGGTVIVAGVNDTDEVIDSTTIAFDLLDDEGEPIDDSTRSVTVTLWEPDEEISLPAPVFAEGEIGTPTCEVGDVSPGRYSERETFDAEAASCQLVESDLGTDIELDLGEVADAPDDEELFAVLALYDGERRIAESSATVEAGAESATVSVVTDATEATCKVLELRLP